MLTILKRLADSSHLDWPGHSSRERSRKHAGLCVPKPSSMPPDCDTKAFQPSVDFAPERVRRQENLLNRTFMQATWHLLMDGNKCEMNKHEHADTCHRIIQARRSARPQAGICLFPLLACLLRLSTSDRKRPVVRNTNFRRRGGVSSPYGNKHALYQAVQLARTTSAMERREFSISMLGEP